MRAAVLHLAFVGLDAQTARSSAFEHNNASLAGSRKLGSTPEGVERQAVRGALVVGQRLRLSRKEWERHRTGRTRRVPGWHHHGSNK